MKGTQSLCAAALAAFALALGASAAADQQVEGKQGAKLEQQIQSNLRRDPDLKNNQVSVSVDNAVATLKGTVDTDAEKSKAERLAFVDGITRVDNRLSVGSAGAGQAISDTELTAKVKAKLVADSRLRGAGISVTTNNGVVKLSGTVASQEQNQHAVEIAKNTDGVHRVEDDLRVTTALPPTAPPSNPAPVH